MTLSFLALAFVLSFAAISESQAETAIIASGGCGGECNWVLDSSGKLSITGKGSMTDFNARPISDNVLANGTYTTSAGYGDYWKQITSISIGEGISRIGNRAFQGLSNVKSVSIPKSVQTISFASFDRMSQLKEVNVSKDSLLKNVEQWAFAQSFSLNSVDDILNALSNNQNANIGYQAFYLNPSESIIIPETLTYMDEQTSAFLNVKEIVIPASLTANQVALWNIKAFADVPENIIIKCLGDVDNCKDAIKRYLPSSLGGNMYF